MTSGCCAVSSCAGFVIVSVGSFSSSTVFGTDGT